MIFKLCLCMLVVFAFGDGISASPVNRPTKVANLPVFTTSRAKEMTAAMQEDVVEAFKRAYTHLHDMTDICSAVRQIFLEKYPEYKWHVAMYKAYSIQSLKSIEVKADEDKYVLFATKK